MDHLDALQFLMAGATAVQVGTATFLDPFAIPKIVKGIDDYMKAHDIAEIGAITGSAGVQNRAL